jgi:hypothetical protein
MIETLLTPVKSTTMTRQLQQSRHTLTRAIRSDEEMLITDCARSARSAGRAI